MVVTNSEQKKIIQGLLPDLAEAWEEDTLTQNIAGADLIRQGKSELLINGIIQPVNPNQIYAATQPVKFKVKHTEQIKAIIAAATDQEDLEERLGAYLCRYGKDFNNANSEAANN